MKGLLDIWTTTTMFATVHVEPIFVEYDLTSI